MMALIRAVKFAVLLVLAVVTVSLVIGMFRPETGVLEKSVLAILVSFCAGLGARVLHKPTGAGTP
jgi:hypothetical protein